LILFFFNLIILNKPNIKNDLIANNKYSKIKKTSLLIVDDKFKLFDII